MIGLDVHRPRLRPTKEYPERFSQGDGASRRTANEARRVASGNPRHRFTRRPSEGGRLHRRCRWRQVGVLGLRLEPRSMGVQRFVRGDEDPDRGRRRASLALASPSAVSPCESRPRRPREGRMKASRSGRQSYAPAELSAQAKQRSGEGRKMDRQHCSLGLGDVVGRSVWLRIRPRPLQPPMRNGQLAGTLEVTSDG